MKIAATMELNTTKREHHGRPHAHLAPLGRRKTHVGQRGRSFALALVAAVLRLVQPRYAGTNLRASDSGIDAQRVVGLGSCAAPSSSARR